MRPEDKPFPEGLTLDIITILRKMKTLYKMLQRLDLLGIYFRNQVQKISFSLEQPGVSNMSQNSEKYL